MVPSEFERFLHDFAAAVETAMQEGLPESRVGLSEARVLALESAPDTTDRMTAAYRYETALRVLTERFIVAEEPAPARTPRPKTPAPAEDSRRSHRAHPGQSRR